MNKTVIAAAALIATVLPVAGLPVAGATAAHAGGGDVIRHGSCSGSTDWTMKAKPDNGRIEVEAEVDSSATGQTWTWTLRHDGRVAGQGRSTTTGPSGSFDVARRTGNGAGADDFRFRAVNPGSGEVCVARVRL